MFSSASSSSLLRPPQLRRHPNPNLNPRPRPKPYPSLGGVGCSFSDPFILEIAEKLEDSLPQSQPQRYLENLRSLSSHSLLSKPWPTSKHEPFRFTDLSLLKNSQITPVNPPNPGPIPESPGSPILLTVLNGHVIPSLSRAGPLPPSAFAGSLRHLPRNDKIHSLLNDRFVDGDLFFDLNGVGAPDVAVVYVPAGARVWESPVHMRFCYDEGSEVGEGRLPVSNPRVLVVAERGGCRCQILGCRCQILGSLALNPHQSILRSKSKDQLPCSSSSRLTCLSNRTAISNTSV